MNEHSKTKKEIIYYKILPRIPFEKLFKRFISKLNKNKLNY